jgi:hypothetical protein
MVLFVIVLQDCELVEPPYLQPKFSVQNYVSNPSFAIVWGIFLKVELSAVTVHNKERQLVFG